MTTLITLLIICAIAAACFWLIGQIPDTVPSIIRSILAIIVVIVALQRVFNLL